MKKTSYKSGKGASFRTYFHGNRMTNGCTIRKKPQKKEGKA